MIFFSKDTAAIYKLSNIFLEYDTKFDKFYAAVIDEMYAGTASISYNEVTYPLPDAVHKDTSWKINVKTSSLVH